MNRNNSIIGTFVRKEDVSEFIDELYDYYGIRKSSVFVFAIDSNDEEYIVTFKSDGEYTKLENSTVMHIKNGSLFSINALNRLIEREKPYGVPNSEYRLDWSKYKDKLIIVTNGELVVSNIEKLDTRLF